MSPTESSFETNVSTGASMLTMLEEMFPWCRSLTGDGLRRTLRRIQQEIPIQLTEVPSGTRVFDWEIPPEWNVRDAVLETEDGEKLIEFAHSNLHLLNYSGRLDRLVEWSELDQRLYSLPDQPDAIPYRTSYYRRDWGFCVSHTHRGLIEKTAQHSRLRARIETEHSDRGSLTYGELVLPGKSDHEILFSQHVCHPSLANDNLSAVVIACELAKWLAAEPRKWTYRFVFAPGTIGAITWAAQHPWALARNRGGLVLALLGDAQSLTYKQTRRGNSVVDHAAKYVLRSMDHRDLQYYPQGYDERQYNSVGIGLDIGRLSRSIEGGYAEYHNSGDNPSIVSPQRLEESLETLTGICLTLESDVAYRAVDGRGEPQLGRRGLYPHPKASSQQGLQDAITWNLGLSDGETSLTEVANRSGLDPSVLHDAAEILQSEGLLVEQTGSRTAEDSADPASDSADPASDSDCDRQEVFAPGIPSRAAKARNRRAHEVIPGGAHTYAKGDDQFPLCAPKFISHGLGCHVYDTDGNRFIEYGSGLRAVALGHAFPPVVEAAQRQLTLGANFTRPAEIELDAAEEFLSLLPAADMVKFAKNGSDATTAAIRLARAKTKRKLVLVCRDQPFFSVDDWFIGTTAMNAGIPDEIRSEVIGFPYGDLEELERALRAHEGQVACLIMEAANYREPPVGYLHAVQAMCGKNGVVFVLDEMITGFRWNAGGAQAEYGLEPDLSTFGKALGNGLSVAALAGKRELMELGGIDHDQERVFLLSYTHGAETHSLAAARATIRTYLEQPVIETMHRQGGKLQEGLTSIAEDLGIAEHFYVLGRGCNMIFVTEDASGDRSQGMRTLLLQELIKRSVFAPSLVVSYAHSDADIDLTIGAFGEALKVYKRALSQGWEHLLDGRPSKPVFRKWN
ncbi:MAG: glutamate-1-semialdehyde 2,1-aminomutase [Planctomycetota bacterium]